MTTPTREQDCAHDQIQSWHFEDGTGHAGMWSCKGCGLKFVPITESMAARAQALDEAQRFVRGLGNDWDSDDLHRAADNLEALKGKQ